ncbi:MAG: PIN domain-containing protein [Acidobacteriaceae bacterium]
MAQILILDTNVISELMLSEPAAQVSGWFERQPSGSVCTTAITVAEIFFGIQVLPTGRKRALLESFAERVFDLLPVRLPFDERSAVRYADHAALRRSEGRQVAIMDLQIAAIASTHDAAIATRNTRDFEGFDLRLINPWLQTY